MAPRDGDSTDSITGGGSAISGDEHVDWAWIDTLKTDDGILYITQ